MKFIFSGIFLLIFCASCEWLGNSPSFGDDFVSYTIRAGNNEVEHNTSSLFTSSSIRFQAIFDSSSIYQTAAPENQVDINKLIGFSDCSTHHQQNSARFGWNWYNNAIQIYAYNYVAGQRQVKELGAVEIGTTNNFKIATSGNNYIFTLNGKEQTMPRHCAGGVGVSYKLLPYFGGNEIAPHDITIKVRFLD
ncbi:hypothetical protein [Dyadobacter sp. 32]|uniref:hypothetical protein n=1 Tax=Dyadobacter sp. 32 TaxID=538966 RepID=UPI0011EC4AA6